MCVIGFVIAATVLNESAHRYISASKELKPGETITWEEATQLWQTDKGRRNMVAAINMADMAMGQEPRYRWGRCTSASWKYDVERSPSLTFTEPGALPIAGYSKLYQAMQSVRAVRC